MHKGNHLAPYWLLTWSEGISADYSLRTGFLATGTPQYKMMFCDLSLRVTVYHKILSWKTEFSPMVFPLCSKGI